MQTDSYEFYNIFLVITVLGTLLCWMIVIRHFALLFDCYWVLYFTGGYSALVEDFYWVLRFAGGLDTRLFLELKIFKLIIGAIEHISSLSHQYLKLWFDMRTKYWQYYLFIYLHYILQDERIYLVLAVLSLHIPQLYTPRLKNRSSIGSIISTYTSIIYSKVIE